MWNLLVNWSNFKCIQSELFLSLESKQQVKLPAYFSVFQLCKLHFESYSPCSLPKYSFWSWQCRKANHLNNRVHSNGFRPFCSLFWLITSSNSLQDPKCFISWKVSKDNVCSYEIIRRVTYKNQNLNRLIHKAKLGLFSS